MNSRGGLGAAGLGNKCQRKLEYKKTGGEILQSFLNLQLQQAVTVSTLLPEHSRCTCVQYVLFSHYSKTVMKSHSILFTCVAFL